MKTLAPLIIGRFKSALLLACISVGVVTSSVQAASAKIEKMHTELIAKIPLYDDPELAAYVDRIGQKLVKNSHHAERKYLFFVLDDPGINAFTPGGGYIYMNRGLLALMTSEAQLAGVLAHEIGHNTGNHIGRTKTRSNLGNLAAIAASIIAGNSNVGNSIQLANQAKLSSFGREMELEADQYAAQYLYKSNYDPQAMLGVLGVLKDHEVFSSLRNRRKGKGATYHGAFSSHPRNDKRLQEVIAQAGALAPGESFHGRDSMREMLTGVIYGRNYHGNKVAGRERFTHKGLGITFTFPQDWQRTNKGKDIILKNADKTLQLKMSLQKTVDRKLSSKQALEKKYPDDLSKVEAIDKEATKDLGTIARRPQQRVALIRVGKNSYYFQGIAKNNKVTKAQDQQFIEIIRSFRRATSEDLPPDSIKSIYYQRLEPGQTFAELAKGAELGMYTEEHLRLMNGYYPNGEPEPGTWMKLVKSGPLPATHKQADAK